VDGVVAAADPQLRKDPTVGFEAYAYPIKEARA
jgi:hypothetical protein